MVNRLSLFLCLSAASPLLLTAGEEGPAPAPTGYVSERLNERLPSWVRFNSEERIMGFSRDGLDFDAGADRYVLQRLRVDVDAAPVRWLKFHVEGQDSRDYFTRFHPAPNGDRDPLDLRHAYVDIGDTESGILGVRAGRQSLTLGEGRYIGDSDWSNVGRSFDGVRLMSKIRSVRLEAFSGMMDEVHQGSLRQPLAGEHLHGVSAAFTHLVPRATVEAFGLWRLAHETPTEFGEFAHRNEKAAGLRWVGELPYGFDYGTDFVLERGTIGQEPIRAWSQHYLAGLTLPNKEHRPRIFTEFTTASGDRNEHDGVHNTFDPLFPAGHDDFGLADRFEGTNLLHTRTGLQYRIREHLEVSAAYSSFWVANRNDGLYEGTTLIMPANNSGSRHVAQELDFQGTWQARPTSRLIFGYAHILPGQWLHTAGHDEPYNFVYMGLVQRF